MKIVHILKELKFSGAEIMYVDAAPVFQKKGCELIVAATTPQIGEFAPHFERVGYKIIHKPFPALKSYLRRLKFYRNFIKYIKSENIDVVHIHFFSAMWGLAMCSWIAKKKSVYTVHAIVHSNYYSYFYHCLLRWSAKKIFKCKIQSIGDSVYDHELKVYRNKTIKIRNWYGSNRYFPAQNEEKKQIRKELDIAENTLVLISVGGCDHNKRHHDIINALPIIKNQIPHLLYIHLGTGKTEDEEKDLTKHLEINEDVRFYGNQSDVRKYLVASDMYLMTSKSEGMPITAIEAMACNIPSVFYNVTGLRDFNKDGENSRLIEENHEVLAEEIIYLYNNPDIRDLIVFNAKKMVTENYDMKTNVSLIYDLYQ